jgi:sialic acid synthase SpsE
MPNAIFEDLFVLELANNHLGSVERGLKIIEQFSQIVRFNNVKASIKLQFRDVDHFIHADFRDVEDIRYIKKTRATKLSHADYATLVNAIIESNCIPMATPFDEASVQLCEFFNLPIIKIASSSINDWPLVEAIAVTKRPVIVSTGGSSEKDTDDIVKFFTKRNILLALNHCVSIYPTEDAELELNQIDYLKKRYPNIPIGFSTHEYHDSSSSIMLAYAKGARLFERHIDINYQDVPVSPYCSLPEQVDVWFKAHKKAVEMCGAPGTQKRISPKKEINYLDGMVRGIYAKRDLPKGYRLLHTNMDDDIYAAVPLQKGQISCRELMSGEVLLQDIKMHAPVKIDDIDSVYANNEDLKKIIYQRGVPCLSK